MYLVFLQKKSDDGTSAKETKFASRLQINDEVGIRKNI